MDTFQTLLREAEDVGWIPKPQPVINISPEHEAGLQLCEELKTLPFCCDDETLHIKNPDYQSTARCCHSHIIGLPTHSATGEVMFLTPYQLDFANKVIHGRDNFGNAIEKLRGSLKMHIKKGRQMGFTEIVLRLILFFCFTRYAGANIGIIAATNGSLARKDLRRFARLAKPISPVVEHWVKNTKEGVCLRLVNDTVIWAFSASEEAMTGDTKYKCILMDEAAKWRLTEDKPVFNSIMPIVKTNGADLYLVSTPKGPIKSFYKIDMEGEESGFVFFVYDIYETVGNLNTKAEVDEMVNASSSAEDPKQEYLCEYVAGSDSIFGTVTAQDMQGKKEWIMEESEDDGYNEDRSEDDSIHDKGEWIE